MHSSGRIWRNSVHSFGLGGHACRPPHNRYMFFPSPRIWRRTEHSAQAVSTSLFTGHLPGLCLGDYSGIRSVTPLQWRPSLVNNWLSTNSHQLWKNRVSHPYPNAQPLNLLFFAARFLLVILRKCCEWRTQQRNAQTCDNHQPSHSDHSELSLQHTNKQPVSLTIHFFHLVALTGIRALVQITESLHLIRGQCSE